MIKHELDCIAQFYGAVINDDAPDTFYFSVKLKKEVNSEILQKAVDELIIRLPHLNGQLENGFLRNYIKVLNKPLLIKKKEKPTTFARCHKKGRDSMFRVYYESNHITVETTHLICDGRSLAKIAISLLARYFELLGVNVTRGDLINFADTLKKEEIEDVFAKHLRDADPKEKTAIFKRYTERQKEINKDNYLHGQSTPSTARVVSKTFDAEKVKASAKEHNATVSELILANIFKILKEERDKKGNKKAITIALPVDYRSFFPSETLLTFVQGKVITMPETDDMGKMIEAIKLQVKDITKDYVYEDIIGFASVINMMHYLPLPLKKLLFRAAKPAGYSTMFSNLGLIRLPTEIESFVESVEFAICPESNKEAYSFCCATTANALVVTVSMAVEGVDGFINGFEIE